MTIRNGLFGSLLLSTLLLSGCSESNDVESSQAAASTVPNNFEASKPVVSEQVTFNKKAPISLTSEQSASLNATTKSVKIAVASLNSNKNTQADQNSAAANADIIHSFYTSDLDSGSGVTYTQDGAYNYFLSLIESSTIILGQSDATSFEAMEVSEFNRLYTAGYFRAAANNYKSLSAFDFFGESELDPFKYLESINGNVNSDLLDPVLTQIFSVMLNNGDLSVEMIDLALLNSNLTPMIIDAMGNNWALLTPKIATLLKKESAFAQKLTELAATQANFGNFLFANIDQNMFSALSQAMVSTQQTAVNVSNLLITYAPKHLKIPTNSVDTSELRSFSTLIFSNGEMHSDSNASTRNDANELNNERFFYALFKSPIATANFITAMNSVQANDIKVSTALMNQIFLGERKESGLTISDVDQSFYNIYAIVGGIAHGMKTDGASEYVTGLSGFARLVPVDSFFAYSKRFASAGMSYLTRNDIDPQEFLSVTQDAMFNYTAFPESEVQKTLNAEDDTTNNDAWYETLWDNVSVGSIFGSLSEWWATASGEYGSYISSISDKVGALVDTGIDYVSAEVHVVLENEIQELLGQAEYVLPPFSEIGYDYISGEVLRQVDDYITINGYTGILRDISDSSYVNEYIYEDAVNLAKSTEVWKYIPIWMTEMDWLKLPASYENYQLEFTADQISVYFLSKNDSLADMRLITGLDNLIQVDSLGDRPISDETEDFYIYKIVVFNGDSIDLSGLEDAGDEVTKLLSGIIVDSDGATVTSSN